MIHNPWLISSQKELIGTHAAASCNHRIHRCKCARLRVYEMRFRLITGFESIFSQHSYDKLKQILATSWFNKTLP